MGDALSSSVVSSLGDSSHRVCTTTCSTAITSLASASFTDDLTSELGSAWSILETEARPRPAVDPDGQPVTVHDVVLVARRRR